MVNFRKKLNGAFALRPQNEIDPLQGRRGGSSYCRRIIEFQYYQESKFLFEMIVKDLIYIEKKKNAIGRTFLFVSGTIWIASLSSQCRKCRNEHFETERIKGFFTMWWAEHKNERSLKILSSANYCFKYRDECLNKLKIHLTAWQSFKNT